MNEASRTRATLSSDRPSTVEAGDERRSSASVSGLRPSRGSEEGQAWT